MVAATAHLSKNHCLLKARQGPQRGLSANSWHLRQWLLPEKQVFNKRWFLEGTECVLFSAN
jgi:hypothetical protein